MRKIASFKGNLDNSHKRQRQTEIYSTLQFIFLCVYYGFVLLLRREHSEKECFLLVTHNTMHLFRYSGLCAYAWVMGYPPLYLSFPILWQQASYSLRAIFLPPGQSALTCSHCRAVMNIRCTAQRNNIMSDGCLNTLHKYNPEYIDYVCPTAGRRPVIIPLLFSVR